MGEDYSLPFERQLQLLFCLYYIIQAAIVTFLSFFSMYLLFTKNFYIVLPYFAWLVYDRNKCNTGGRISHWFKKHCWWKKLARDYFPVRLLKTVDLDPKKNYMCGSHPHGYMSVVAVSNIGLDCNDFGSLFPGITPRILSFYLLFHLPFLRDYLLALGK
ncbi:Diacylglycerol O-acyltransferase 2 [Chamberlinius hualienensis]